MNGLSKRLFLELIMCVSASKIYLLVLCGVCNEKLQIIALATAFLWRSQENKVFSMQLCAFNRHICT